MPAPMFARNLTGRSNHRANFFGQLVLQVEYVDRVGHGGRPQPGQPTYVEVLKWRDAKVSDIRALDWFVNQPSSPPPSPRKI